MVTRITPDPRLVTDSMASGGVPRERYSMSAPGSPSIEDYTMPAAAGFNDLTDVPQQSGPTIPISDVVHDNLGRFTGETTSAWTQVPGLSR